MDWMNFLAQVKRSSKRFIAQWVTRRLVIRGVKLVSPTQVVIPSEPIHRIAPFHLGQLHAKFTFPAPGIIANSEPAHLLVCADVVVVGDMGAVVNRRREVMTTSPWSVSWLNLWSKQVYANPTVHLRTRTLCLAARHAAFNYYHWMTDLLPRLEILHRAGYRIADFDCILVSHLSLPFQRETLIQLGLPQSKLLSMYDATSVGCAELVCPTEPCLSGNTPRWIIVFLRQVFASWMTEQPASPKRIFIGRKPGGKRQLLNQAEVQSRLEKQGITSYYLDEMRVQEQVSLFFNAELIIAVHGAALTNLVFCRDSATVIELFPVSYVNQCYWTLASHVGMHYGYLVGTGEDRTTLENHLLDTDFSISLIELGTIIENVTKINSKQADDLSGDLNLL
jgi:capsular polysaccharide biosynthesis protein